VDKFTNNLCVLELEVRHKLVRAHLNSTIAAPGFTLDGVVIDVVRVFAVWASDSHFVK
jgi:hypothetical protein